MKEVGENSYSETLQFESLNVFGTALLVASLVAQSVKNLPAMRETWVPSLSWKDPLEKGTATHSSILAWRIPRTGSLACYSPWGCQDSDTTEWFTHIQLSESIFFLSREMALVCVCCLLSPKVHRIPWEANEAGKACRRQLPDVCSFCSLVRFVLLSTAVTKHQLWVGCAEGYFHRHIPSLVKSTIVQKSQANN